MADMLLTLFVVAVFWRAYGSSFGAAAMAAQAVQVAHKK